MRTQEFIQAIANRTRIPHDEVRIVLEAARDVICDRLSVYEGCVFLDLMKISAKPKKGGGHKVHVAPYKALINAVQRYDI